MHPRDQLLLYWKKQKVDVRLLAAFQAIPREIFVSEDIRSHAYDDHPLPTLRGQSLSQPSTVMLMLQALQVKSGHQVYEIGSGVGYQACLLGKIVGPKGKVITTEIIPELVQASREHARQLDLNNVIIMEKDGSRGMEEGALFDRVIITCACPKIPEPIIEQVKEGGIIVAPVGDLREQIMVRAVKVGQRLDIEFLGPFVFVPMQGKYGFEQDMVVR